MTDPGARRFRLVGLSLSDKPNPWGGTISLTPPPEPTPGQVERLRADPPAKFRMPEGETAEWPDHGACEICGEHLYGGSHYHCAKCRGKGVTSMLGHYTAIHVVDGKMVDVGHHMCCPGDCELEAGD